jgi:hypothetical protein
MPLADSFDPVISDFDVLTTTRSSTFELRFEELHSYYYLTESFIIGF